MVVTLLGQRLQSVQNRAGMGLEVDSETAPALLLNTVEMIASF